MRPRDEPGDSGQCHVGGHKVTLVCPFPVTLTTRCKNQFARVHHRSCRPLSIQLLHSCLKAFLTPPYSQLSHNESCFSSLFLNAAVFNASRSCRSRRVFVELNSRRTFDSAAVVQFHSAYLSVGGKGPGLSAASRFTFISPHSMVI